MKIMGIDPGLARTGLGIIEVNNNSFKLVNCELIETEPSEELPKRLLKIYNQTLDFIEQYLPNECGIEEIFFSKNAKSAFLVGQARGTIILAISQKKIPIYEYTPIQIKQAICGYGRGKKNQLKYIVEKILNLNSTKKSTGTKKQKSKSLKSQVQKIFTNYDNTPLNIREVREAITNLEHNDIMRQNKGFADDVIDALSVAICHANSRKMQSLINQRY